MSKAIATSGMFGAKTEAQALSLMLLCQAEGLHPVLAVRRYHIIEGKPSMRADALQGEFEASGGAILWHERNDHEVSATFWKDRRHATAEAQERATHRYQRIKNGQSISDLARLDEMTIVRTFEDAKQKGLAMTLNDNRQRVLKKNWEQSPRQMLHARCLSEGVRAVRPGILAGIYVEDEAFDRDNDDIDLSSAEDKVKAATANRMIIPITTSRGDYVGTVHVKVDEENFTDVICHVGQPKGDIIGKRVGELHPRILEWLRKHHGPEGLEPRWGVMATAEDVQLKDAIDIALAKLEEE